MKGVQVGVLVVGAAEAAFPSCPVTAVRIRRVAGMVMAAELSDLDPGDLDRLRNLLEVAGLPASPPAIGAQAMLTAMGMDKKVMQKQLRFVLLRQLGEAVVTTDYDESRLQQVLRAAD